MIQAAKYLGVAPWDLRDQHPFWQRAAYEAHSAEAAAEKRKGDRDKALGRTG